MLSCTLSVFWTTVTSQTSSEEEWMNRDTVKPTVTFGSRAGFKKASVFSQLVHAFAQFEGCRVGCFAGPQKEVSAHHQRHQNLLCPEGVG